MKKHALFFILSLALVSCPLFACSDSDDNSSPAPQNNQGNTDPNDPNQGNTDVDFASSIKSVKSKANRSISAIADDKLSVFVHDQYDLNFDLLRKTADQIEQNNAMISTFSIQTALAMTWAGASGDTAKEMADALHFGDNAHEALNKLDTLIQSKNLPVFDSEYGEHADPVEIKTSNNLYFSPKYTWKNDWLDVLAQNYDAGITEMNFAADPEAARKYINDIVSNDTHERIQDLLPENSITGDTQAVITNAIYFKAPWKDSFYIVDDLSFNKLDKNSIKAKAIKAGEKFNYMKTDQYQAVSVPLRQNNFNMMFILPENDEFESVATTLSGDMLDKVFKEMTRDAEVHFTLPVFSFTTTVALENPFKALGMTLPFDMSKADFSAMTEEENSLYIDAIYHKSFVGVDEKGVEAAAATAVTMADNAMPPEEIEPIELVLDRPFFFIIYETETHTPLFVGRVMDPSAK